MVTMPGKVKVRIVAGRNLPVMDKSSDTSDAYVEVKMGTTTFKTDVHRKSLNPTWNSEWFKFEVDDEELQDEPLQIRIMDYDTYSANDAIGKVYIDLNPLVLPQNTGSVMSGWIPIFDTMHGIRGEVNITVKVELFSDFNRFRQSSCGVQFFCTPGIPQGHRAHLVHGFVEELVVNDDPEYQWIDKIRTPRASNEARQTLFSKLSGEVQRKIGLKTLELGGNAVLGYRQCFDLEGESGIVVRGIGTAVTLARHQVELLAQPSPSPTKDGSRECIPLDHSAFHYPMAVSPCEPSVPVMRFISHPATFRPSCFPPAPTARVVSTVACPPLVESKHRGRSRFHSIAAGFPSAPLRQPRLAFLGFFRPRSQSTSSADDEHSLALERYLTDHHAEAEMEEMLRSPSPIRNASLPPRCSPDPICISIPSPPSSSSAPTSPRDASYFPCPCCTPPHSPLNSRSHLCTHRSPLPEDGPPNSPITRTPFKFSQSPVKNPSCVCRRSSDSELNVTAKGSSCNIGAGNATNGCSSTTTGPSCTNRPRQQALSQPESMEMLEYPFLSMTQYPLGFIAHLGGVVSAHSVKLLGRINNPDEPETRDAWWTEIRMEIRSHARALACNVVLGYSESTSICDDICILSASGTAAIVCLYHAEAEANRRDTMPVIPSTPSSSEKKENERPVKSDCFLAPGKTKATLGDTEKEELVILMSGSNMTNQCSICHIPYSEASIPFPVILAKCALCRKSKVPDVLFATIAPPPAVPITGKGCLIQARVCRMKKDSKNELNAKEISDSLPFLQYELHRQLLNKLKVKGMNALFGLRVQVSVGAKILVAVATATAVFLTALPTPQVPRISSGKSTDGSKLQEIQRLIADTITRNQDLYNLHPVTQEVETPATKEEDEDDSEDDLPELDLSCGNKDACILEIDDSEDADIIALLIDPRTPDGFDMVNVGFVPGVECIARNLQMFTRVCRTKLPSSTLSCRQLSQYFENITQSLYFKLRKMTPCALCNLQYTVELADDDELQVTVLGMAVGLGDPALDCRNATTIELSPLKPLDSDTELMFKMEEELPVPHAPILLPRPFIKNPRPTNRVKIVYHTVMKGERYGIDITPLAVIPGAPIERYLGNLNFFFIRESTSIRENGGLSGFVQSFIAEVLAIVRAHVAALGGNAMVAYFMSECVLLHNPHKNQGQCLINVGGDVVQAFNSLQLLTPHSAPLPDTTSAITCRGPLRSSPKEPKAFLIGSQG